MRAYARMCVFHWVWGTSKTTLETCVCIFVVQCELYEFAEPRFKLPFWEPAFPALLKRTVRDWRGFGNEEAWASFTMSQVCLLYTVSGNNGRVKYLIYTPNPGTQLQVIKAGSWQRRESGNCNGRSKFIP